MKYSSDVYFIYHQDDKEFMEVFEKLLKSNGLSVWDGETTHGKGLIDSKVVVIVMSTSSTQDRRCEDEVSLAYISDTPIFPVTKQTFVELERTLSFSMKLILAKINWMFFETEEQRKTNFTTLLSSISSTLEQVTKEQDQQEEQDEDENTPKAWKTRLHSGVPLRECKDFWENKFGDLNEVPWVTFRKAFLEEYDDQLTEKFSKEKIDWLTNLLYGDILLMRNIITKHTYETFCCHDPNEPRDPDRFFSRLLSYAKGTIAMRGVFNMESTVRLDAIQKLGQFKTQSVIAVLLDLSNDKDANVRAVAAISLGKTGIKSKRVSQRMLKMLSDPDRLVREAACISLGRMQIESAVPNIVQVWRKDIISHVRAAAEAALRLIDSDRARQAIQMTEVISSEIHKLTFD